MKLAGGGVITDDNVKFRKVIELAIRFFFIYQMIDGKRSFIK